VPAASNGKPPTVTPAVAPAPAQPKG
jgi:hypothetical protein